jgi:hypothetical protein
MTLADFVSRLQGVRHTQSGGVIARCPAHDDRSPSLSVADRGDGGLLVHCFAGCDAGAIVAAMGLTLGDLMPSRPADCAPVLPRRLRLPLTQALEILALEATVLDLAGSALLRGETLPETDWERVADAVERIHDVRLAVYGGEELARRAASVVRASASQAAQPAH